MRRKLFTCILILMFLVSASFIGCSPSEKQTGPPAEMDPVVLKLAHFWPGGHALEKVVVDPWIAAIEEATEGLVKIDIYPGGTLLGANDIYDGVSEGIADIGISFFSYTPGRFPMVELFELPGISYNNATVAANVFWDFMQQMNPQEVHDTKLMFVDTGGLAHLGTNKPVRKIEDIRGMEIRTTGASALPVSASGGVAVAMAMADSYEALQKGVVNGILGPTSPLKGWNLAEVIDYLTETPFMYTATRFFTMNLETWESFPPEIQDAILEVNEKIFKEAAMSYTQTDDDEGIRFAIEEQGVELIQLEAEETERWTALFDSVREDKISEAEANGLPAREAAELIKELVDKYNAMY